ncbi:MAG TPA: DNA-binding protein [Clostridiaceae bacterium]|jgi:predicted DNA-binding protein with PD1-like motif|nr:DNA-binding protein [Clostridiaceae bacterium]
MEFKKFGNTYLVRINRGEEIVETLKNFAKQNNIKLASITGIGAVGEAKIGLFETSTKKYISRNLKGDFEIVSITGNISTMNKETYLHIHICLADKNNNTYGGHLSEAKVSVTGEIFVNVLDGEVDRKLDSDIGINLIKF